MWGNTTMAIRIGALWMGAVSVWDSFRRSGEAGLELVMVSWVWINSVSDERITRKENDHRCRRRTLNSRKRSTVGEQVSSISVTGHRKTATGCLRLGAVTVLSDIYDVVTRALLDEFIKEKVHADADGGCGCSVSCVWVGDCFSDGSGVFVIKYTNKTRAKTIGKHTRRQTNNHTYVRMIQLGGLKGRKPSGWMNMKIGINSNMNDMGARKEIGGRRDVKRENVHDRIESRDRRPMTTKALIWTMIQWVRESE